VNSTYPDTSDENDDPDKLAGSRRGQGNDTPQMDAAASDVPVEATSQIEPLEVTEIFNNPIPLPVSFQNLAAVGGSVGALVLGIWSIVGAALTPYSMINAILGILMGFWGLSSTKKTMATVGLALCVVGLALSLGDVNEVVSNYFYPAEEM